MPQTPGNTPARRFFVGNLPSTVDENVLRNEFAAYGNVDHVELKTKGYGESQAQFAFVTVSGAAEHDINRCVKRFSREKFHGHQLKVEVARESFLERLKREREEAAQSTPNHKPREELQETSNGNLKISKQEAHPKVAGHVKNFPAEKESRSSSDSSESDSEEDGKDTKLAYKASPTKAATNQTDEQDDVTFISKKNAFSSVQNGKIKIESVASEPLHVICKKSQSSKNLQGTAQQSDEKRKESLHKMKDQYNKQRMAIKQALTNIDTVKKSSKIVFDDNDRTAIAPISSSKQPKRNLFNEDDAAEDNAEDYTKDFQIKEHFQGKKGEQLMRLQSKFKADSRFAMDSRFLEDGDENVTASEEAGDNDERQWQLGLIEQVVGKKMDTTKPPQQKEMKGLITRFDPSKEEHKKFYKMTTDRDVEESVDTEKSTQQEYIEHVEVSKDQFYRVDEDLTKTLLGGNEGFSLLSMFGQVDRDSSAANDEMEPYAEFPLSASQQKSSAAVGNPFKYDSSDSEDNEDDRSGQIESPATKPSNASAPKQNAAAKSKNFHEKFFLFATDKRLEQGLEFFKAPERDSERDYDEVKRNLQKIIYRKMAKKRKGVEGFKTVASKFKKSRNR